MEIIENRNNQAVTTSLQVAETFGKSHQHVLRDIEGLNKQMTVQNWTADFAKGTYKNKQNHEYKMYYMTKDGFTLLAMGFTGKKAMKFKMEYINAFNQMEHLIEKEQRLPQSPEEKLALTMEVASRTENRVSKIEDDVQQLKDNVLVSSSEYGTISSEVSKRVYGYLNDREYPVNNNNTSLLFSDIGHGIKRIANVKTRSRIKAKDFDKVMEFIDAWQPATATRMELTKGAKVGVN